MALALTPFTKTRKRILKEDIARMQAGQLGLTMAEQESMAGAAAQQAGAGIQGVQQGVAQQALAGSPVQGVSGRAALLQRQLGSEMGQAGALARSEAARLSQEKAMGEKASIEGALERQQERARQNAQFWADLLRGTMAGASEAAIKAALIA